MRCRSVSTTMLLMACVLSKAPAQTIREAPAADAPGSAKALGNPDAAFVRTPELAKALSAHDYTTAEGVLVRQIDEAPRSAESRRRLIFLANLFFVDGKYLNAAVAWSKANKLAPLDDDNRFSLAMAEIQMKRPDWARAELERLARRQPQKALYQYWLARLEYDAQQYLAAIERLKSVVKLDPGMARAYDKLGLCYDYLGQLDQAMDAYEHAVALNRKQAHPSPWPHIDFAIALKEAGRTREAIEQLHEAIRVDGSSSQAFYQLGLALDSTGDLQGAADAWQRSAQLDATDPEPHYALGRVLSRMHRKEEAAAEVATYQRLKTERLKVEQSATVGQKATPSSPLQH